MKDPILSAIIQELKEKHRCHTIILYGSRARGLTTPTSDYDVIGVRKRGAKTRIAKRDRGYFWDVFVYAEKDLRKLRGRTFGLEKRDGFSTTKARMEGSSSNGSKN